MKGQSVLPNVVNPAVYTYRHEHVEVNPQRKPMFSFLVAHPVDQCRLVYFSFQTVPQVPRHWTHTKTHTYTSHEWVTLLGKNWNNTVGQQFPTWESQPLQWSQDESEVSHGIGGSKRHCSATWIQKKCLDFSLKCVFFFVFFYIGDLFLFGPLLSIEMKQSEKFRGENHSFLILRGHQLKRLV